MKELTHNIFLIGGMGAGKTTIGRKLSEMLNYEFYDTDREIEQVTGVDIPWIFELEGETGFRRREHLMVKELTQRHHIILATGGGTILDIRNRELLTQNGTVIYLKTTIEHQLDRLSRDKRRPLLQVENRQEVLTNIMSNREELYHSTADYIIETGAKPITNVVNEVIAAVFHSQPLVP